MKLIPLQQWICDSCSEMINNPRDGWFEWYEEKNYDAITGFRIVHNRQSCMYNDQAMERQNKSVLDLNLTDVIGADGLAHMVNKLDHDRFKNLSEFTEMLRRLHLPNYEEAKQYWSLAKNDGLFDGNEYNQSSLLQIINDYGAD